MRPEQPHATGAIAAATRAEALTSEQPVGRSTGWWGMVLFVVTEATLFAALLSSYFYLRFQAGPQWPTGQLPIPKLVRPLIMTAVLLPSSLPMIWAERGIRRGQRWRLNAGVAATLLLGTTFLVLVATEYADQLKEFTLTTNVYGSLFYAVTGFHSLHVTVGLLLLSWLLAASVRGRFDAHRHERVRIVAIYWHFVDVVWAAIVFTIYLSPRL